MKNPTMFKIGIIESKDFCSRAQKHLETIGEVSFYNPSSNNLDSFIQDKEVIFVRLGYLFNEKLLRNAKKLKYICSPTTGLNHIDLNYVKKREIRIISLKGEVDFLDKITATSEHTVGLLISLSDSFITFRLTLACAMPKSVAMSSIVTPVLPKSFPPVRRATYRNTASDCASILESNPLTKSTICSSDSNLPLVKSLTPSGICLPLSV